MKTVYFLLLVSAFMIGGCAGGKSPTHETNETPTHTPNPGSNTNKDVWHKLRAIIAGNSDAHISSEELNRLEGVSRAKTGRDYTTALKLAHYNDRNNPTSAEIQAVIDAVNANHPPRISGKPSEAVQAKHTYTFTPHAVDDDNDTLHFSLVQKPDWLSISPSTGTVRGTPPASEIGKQAVVVVVQVDDGKEIAVLPPFTITVKKDNHPPTLRGNPTENIDADQPYTFTPDANDTDGDTLVFSIKNKPTWADFNESTGTLSGTPNNADAKTYNNIILSVTDGTDTVDLRPFKITVKYVNHPPSISGTPPAVWDVNKPYSFTPTTNDPDGDILYFSLANAPDWLDLNTSNGRLSGIPRTTGISPNITLSVHDGNDTRSFSFSLTVKIPIQPCGDTHATPVPSGAHIHPLKSGTHIRLRHVSDGNRTACTISGDAGMILE